MKIELTEEEIAVLLRELTDITFAARYQLSAPHQDPEGRSG